jgi:OPA family glycerol-3-phosphate transporter-like MFS transporter
MLAAGNNPLLTTLVPLRYARYNRMSGVAGYVEFFIYLGSGISGVLSGLFSDQFGWQAVIIYWAIVSLVGASCLLYVHFHDWKY